MTTTANEKRTILVHETKAEYEYDRERVLRIYHLLKDEIEAGWYGHNEGYAEHARTTDDDRIVTLFDLLDQSIFGGWIFSNNTDFDRGCTLIERGDDE